MIGGLKEPDNYTHCDCFLIGSLKEPDNYTHCDCFLIDVIIALFQNLSMDASAPDDEAPKDPGVQKPQLQSFSEKDFEGK